MAITRSGVCLFLATVFCWSPFSEAQSDRVKVRGYTKKDGTYVESHTRSAPNAYRWDNDSYRPSQKPFNESYSAPTKNYGASWYQPNSGRFSDNNPHNDSGPTAYAPSYHLPQPSRESRSRVFETQPSWQRSSAVDDANADMARRREEQRAEEEDREQEAQRQRQRLFEAYSSRRNDDEEEDSNSSYSRFSRPSAYQYDYQPTIDQNYSRQPDTESKYNAFNNSWENVPESYEMKYNPMDNKWSYEAQDSSLQYDAMSNSWGYDSD